MKATIEYKLPEESEQFTVAAKAAELFLCLLELDNLLRDKIKYGEDITTDRKEGYSLIRDSLRDIMYNKGCSLDMMS